jgi:hypothetical protein
MEFLAPNFGFFRLLPLVFNIFSLLGFELYALRGNIHSRGKRDLCERVLRSHRNPQHVQTSSNKSGNSICLIITYLHFSISQTIYRCRSNGRCAGKRASDSSHDHAIFLSK